VGEFKNKVVCFGPGTKFKGGIANYNTSLAKALDKRTDTETHIVSWIQQYPAIVPREFIDKESRVNQLENTNIKEVYITDFNKPGTWKKTADYIVSLNADRLIIQWYNAMQGLPLSRIVKRIRRKSKIEIIFDLHFVVPKENSNLDTYFTKMGLKTADTFIVHSLKTNDELTQLFKGENISLSYDGKRAKNGKSALKLYHPIYDMFKPDENFDIEKFKRDNNLRKHVFLFFGFIRKYKGLHQAIEAFAKVAQQRDDVSLMICGESFWNTLDSSKLSTKIKEATFGLLKKLFLNKEDDEKNYRPLDLIKTLEIEDKVMLVNKFVANEDVPHYFQAADSVVLFYLTATPSGIESISYNFNMPIVATRVGHFPETIEDGFNGYLANDRDISDMVRVMNLSINKPIERKNVGIKTAQMSWDKYAATILEAI
jgi:glycosyltransferase involved in cell wall biosynthesis